MEATCTNLTERILQLTLEIIYLLTGEDDIVAKKASGDRRNSIMVPLQSLLIPERNNEKKILEVTKKIIELLTGEIENWSSCNVSIKEEVKEEEEEWEYLEGHEDLYKDAMMENQLPLTSPDGSSNKNPPERCPHPPYSRNPTQEDFTIPHHDQGVEVIDIKTEVKEEAEMYVIGNQMSMKEVEMMVTITQEESSLDVSTGGHNGWNTSEEHLILSADYSNEDNSMAQCSPGVSLGTQYMNHKINHMVKSTDWFNSEELNEKPHTIIPNVQPSFETVDRSPDSSTVEESSQDNLHPFQDCEKTFIKNQDKLVTQRIHTSKKPFSCSQCEKSFIKKSNLVQHQRTHTGEKPFSCSECGKGFSSKGNRDNHMRIHTGEKPFSCPECGDCFAQKVTLILHQRSHTSLGHCVDQHVELLENKTSLSCSECGESMEKRSALHEHQTGHTGKEIFSCPNCEKSFLRKYDLIIHQRNHTGEPPFSCSECRKSFKDSYKLVQHQRIHTWEKPFSCSVCGKAFTQKSQLNTHQIVHTGEKPFPCPECGKCFPSKGNRDKHMRIHTGEKPFSCSECGKCFAQKVTLIIHQRTHTT